MAKVIYLALAVSHSTIMGLGHWSYSKARKKRINRTPEYEARYNSFSYWELAAPWVVFVLLF